MKKHFSYFFLVVLLLSSCGRAISTPNVELIMARYTPMPTCELFVNEDVTISIAGTVPDGAEVHWMQESEGPKQGMIEGGPKMVTRYKAPSAAGKVTITGEIYQSKKKIGAQAIVCKVLDWPTAVPSVSTVVITDTPALSATSTVTVTEVPTTTETVIILPTIPTLTFTPTPEPIVLTPTFTQTSTPTKTPAQVPSPIPGSAPLVAITEIMANPCNAPGAQENNEYVELFNYGADPVDINGWNLMTSNNQGASDKLVAWSERMGYVPLGEATIDSTLLLPGGYAVLLSPNYAINQVEAKRPYTFPKGTIILTLAKTSRIGAEGSGLISSRGKDVKDYVLDGLLLYTSSTAWVETEVSTYGVSLIGKDPHNIPPRDKLPLTATACRSVQRVAGIWKDTFEAWTVSADFNPGSGPYTARH